LDPLWKPRQEVRSTWHRHPLPPAAPGPITDPRVRQLVEIEAGQVLLDLWAALEVPCVPAAPSVYLDGQLKLRQLALAGRLGFTTPPTLVTSDPRAFRDFYRRTGGRCITKAIVQTAYLQSGLGPEWSRHTELVTPEDLVASQSVALAPVLVQGYVEKSLEVRVTVVGDQSFAAEIQSQASAHTVVDSRKLDHVRTPYLVHALPDEVAARCVALTHRLGLCYSTIDLVRRPDGEYVFLEINPVGEYHWVEVRTGLPITAAICELLVTLARGG
jgi:glutathione synthase/RimK-type ligase-like ATP-grasp enzyme